MKNNRKIINFFIVIFLLFFSVSYIFSGGDSESDDSSDSGSESDYYSDSGSESDYYSDSDFNYDYYDDYDGTYDYNYTEEQDEYHDIAEDILNGDGDNYTDEELAEAAQNAEDVGDYGYADMITDYLENNDDHSYDSDNIFMSYLYKENIEEDKDRMCFIYDLLMEDTTLDAVTLEIIAEALGGYEYISDTVTNIYSSQTVGDPVLVTSGYYYLYETDIYNHHGLRIFSRNYRQDSEELSSIGKKWICNLDARILKGITKIDEDAFKMLKENKEQMNVHLTNIKTMIDEADDYDSEVIDTYDELMKKYNKIVDWYEALLKIKTLSDTNMLKNKYSRYDGMNEAFEFIGNDNYTYIDEKGKSYVLKPSNFQDKMIWESSNKDYKTLNLSSIINHSEIEKLNEEKKQNTIYYELTEKGYLKKYFNYYGLLIKESYPGGEGLVIQRDKNGKVLTITDTHNYVYNIEYKNNYISSITTLDNKCYSYNYSTYKYQKYLSNFTNNYDDVTSYYYLNTGEIRQILKPNKTTIDLTYSIYNVDNKTRKCVSSVKNENNYVEFFNYDFENNKTEHIDAKGKKTIYKYNSNHLILSKKSNSNEVTYFYNSSGLLSKIKEYGYEVEYKYNDKGYITEVNDSYGAKNLYQYNDYGQIVLINDCDNVITKFKYDNYGNITRIQRGNYVEYEAAINSKGFPMYIIDSKNSIRYFDYDENNYINKLSTVINNKYVTIMNYENDIDGKCLIIENALGQKIQYEYNNKDYTMIMPNGLKESFYFNSSNDLVEVKLEDLNTEEVRIKKYEYDAQHNLTKKYNPDFINVYTKYEYDSIGKLIKEQIFDNKETWQVQYYYNETNNLSKKIRSKFIGLPNNSSMFGTEYIENYTYQYEALYQYITKSIDGGITIKDKYSYNGAYTETVNSQNEKIVQKNLPSTKIQEIKNIFGGINIYKYNQDGKLSSYGAKDKNNITFTYDFKGRIKTITNEDGVKLTLSYNDFSQVIKEECSFYTKNYVYDLIGRITKVWYGKDLNNVEYVCEYNYVDDCNKIEIRIGDTYFFEQYLNAFGDIIKEVDGCGNSKEFFYDSNGRCIKVISDNIVKEYKYNGLNKISTIKESNGNFKSFSYDNLGNLLTVRDTQGLLVEYKYDKAGRKIYEKIKGEPIKEYVYDYINRITEIKIANIITEKYEYLNNGKKIIYYDGNNNKYIYEKNNYGQIVKETNRLGYEKKYFYDNSMNNYLTKDFENNSIKKILNHSEKSVAYNYSNPQDNVVVKYNMLGQPISVDNSLTTIYFTYDKGGRLKTQYDKSTGEVVTYQYDNAGRKISLRTNTRQTNYIYDKNNKLVEIKDSKLKISVKFEYDSSGNRVKQIYGNGNEIYTLYNDYNQKICTYEKSSDNKLIWLEAYVYNNDGKISATINENCEVTKYFYDALGNLSKVQYPFNTNLENNAMHELLKFGITNHNNLPTLKKEYFTNNELNVYKKLIERVYPSLLSKLLNNRIFLQEEYEYDKNGNRVIKKNNYGIILYKYDNENRLINVGNTKFTYDKNNNLIKKIYKNNYELYEYNTLNRLIHYKKFSEDKKNYDDVTIKYDGLNRMSFIQDEGKIGMRTIYDGFSTNKISEKAIFSNGKYVHENKVTNKNVLQTGRYRWISDSNDNVQKTNNNYTNSFLHFTGQREIINHNGETFAVYRTMSDEWKDFVVKKMSLESDDVNIDMILSYCQNISYLGTSDNSVKAVSNFIGITILNNNYDAFGSISSKDSQKTYIKVLQESIKVAYAGKDYDSVSHVYNYEYRNYDSMLGRFTTMDPIRDSYNWFVFSKNDPINFFDYLGLEANSKNLNNNLKTNIPIEIIKTCDRGASFKFSDINNALFYQMYLTNPAWVSAYGKISDFKDLNMDYLSFYQYFIMQCQINNTDGYRFTYYSQHVVGASFGFPNTACALSSLVNELVEEYFLLTGNQLPFPVIEEGIKTAIENNNVSEDDATINNWAAAANDIWGATGMKGEWGYGEIEDSENIRSHVIYAEDTDKDGKIDDAPDHFTNSAGYGYYYDPYTDNFYEDTGSVTLQSTGIGPTRDLYFEY